MKVHHTKSHGESLVQSPCEYCGENCRGTFCSNDCQHQHRLETGFYDEEFDIRMEGDENPMKREEVREKVSQSIKELREGEKTPWDDGMNE
jgi:hypothetical protein